MTEDKHWVPDNEDGSGWADVDWSSVIRGSRYHYRHCAPRAIAATELPPFYRVVTHLESEKLRPHENTYYVPSHLLADFLAEMTELGGAEIVWHIEPCQTPAVESRVERISAATPTQPSNQS